jgi:type I restriction enzyme S subunit
MEITATKATFPKYPAYKDSGVKWLGEIPEGWEVLPGLSFITEGKDKNKGMKRKSVLSLSYGNIREKADEELTGLVPESFETYQLVNKGDLIFRPTDLQNDKVSLRSSISNYEGIITSAYLNLRIKQKASAKFYHYFFRAIDNNKIIYGLGSGLRQNISYLDFRRFLFPFPPKQEQTAIANFLDDKTAKIDRAIAQKEQLIALLKERKQIIIQNAVTKGLNYDSCDESDSPDSQTQNQSPSSNHKKSQCRRMKDSGVEWIGEIPEHWEVKALKYIAYMQSGETISPDNFTEEGYPVYGGNGFRGYTDRFTNEGDFALIGRQGALCGNVNYVDGKFYASEHAIVVYPLKRQNVLWLGESIKAADFNRLSQSAAQPGIAVNVIKNVLFAEPPNQEQNLISDFIKDVSSKSDQAISLQQTQIEKLKEYKATLIDSAVTGKIKVSEL